MSPYAEVMLQVDVQHEAVQDQHNHSESSDSDSSEELEQCHEQNQEQHHRQNQEQHVQSDTSDSDYIVDVDNPLDDVNVHLAEYRACVEKIFNEMGGDDNCEGEEDPTGEVDLDNFDN